MRGSPIVPTGPTRANAMKHVLTGAVVAAVMSAAAPLAEAQPRFFDPNLVAPPVAEEVACRVIRERIVRPGGRVVFRERSVCSPRPVIGIPPRCAMIRERIVRPDGSVVFRSVRRCRPI
jgi:hypothetical protein